MVLQLTSLPAHLNGAGPSRPQRQSPPAPSRPVPVIQPPPPKPKQSAVGRHAHRFRRMLPQLFNRIRALLLLVVAIWTLIVLAIAVSFLNILESSEFTTYIPLAIFAACATFFVMIGLIVISCLRKPHPVSHTRFELVWLGVLGSIWLALGAYTTNAPETEVVCWDDDGDIVDDLNGFNNDSYHARYHVLQGFSLFTAILLLGFFLLLLALALRRHFMGRPPWRRPVTTVNWLDLATHSPKRLPLPATARVTITTRTAGDGKLSEKPKVQVKEIKQDLKPLPKPLARQASAPAAPPRATQQTTTAASRPTPPRRTATAPTTRPIAVPAPAVTRGAAPRRAGTTAGHTYVVYIPPHGSRTQPQVQTTTTAAPGAQPHTTARPSRRRAGQ